MTGKKKKTIQVNSRSIRTGIAALGMLALMAHASAKTSTADAFVQRAAKMHAGGKLNVIVSATTDFGADQHKDLAKLGAFVYRQLPLIKAVAVRVPTKNLRQLMALPYVKHVSEDVETKKTDAFTVQSSYADVAWQQYGTLGSGVGVAVLDSGIRDSTEFETPLLKNTQGSLLGGLLLPGKRLKASVNFTKEDANDHCGHGTHVAGILAGNGAQSFDQTKYTQTFFGAAPGANLISVKVLDKMGSGSVTQTIAALQWVVANKAKYNIRVINMSLGHPVGESYETDPLCQAVASVWKNGIVVVCAAGNNGRLNEDPDPTEPDNEGYGTGYGSIDSPANSPYVITVGAMKSMDGVRAHDRVATYSSRGPSRVDYILKPDIMAPGNRVISTQPKEDSYLAKTYPDQVGVFKRDYMKGVKSTDNNYSDQYFRLSGTSMAAPVVSAAVAMMLDKDPKLTPDTIKARLMLSADKWVRPDGDGDACTYGAGYLNIPAALASTVVANSYAMSPSLKKGDDGDIYIDLDPAIWGDRAMWGTGTIDDLRAIWGDRALWGNAIKTGRALWGNVMARPTTRAMWGNSFWDNDKITYINSGGVDLSWGGIAVTGEK